MSLYVTAGKIKKLWRTDNDGALHEVKNLWTDAGQVFSSGPEIEVHEVSLSNVKGNRTFHSFVTLNPPPGEVWQVEIHGTVSGTLAYGLLPRFRIGSGQSSDISNAGPHTYLGEVTSVDSRVGMITEATIYAFGFAGTVTVTKS